MPNRQRYLNDKCAIDFSNFDKSNTNKIVFVKASTKFYNVEQKKVYVIIPPTGCYVRHNIFKTGPNWPVGPEIRGITGMV